MDPIKAAAEPPHEAETPPVDTLQPADCILRDNVLREKHLHALHTGQQRLRFVHGKVDPRLDSVDRVFQRRKLCR